MEKQFKMRRRENIGKEWYGKHLRTLVTIIQEVEGVVRLPRVKGSFFGFDVKEKKRVRRGGDSCLEGFVRGQYWMLPCGEVLHLARTWGWRALGPGMHGLMQPLDQAVAVRGQPRAPTQAYAHGGPSAERLASDNEVVVLLRDGQLRPCLGIVESPARETKFETCKRHRQ